MPLDLSTLTVEDATAEEGKVTRKRTSKVADSVLVPLLKETHEKGTYKKVAAQSPEHAKEIISAIKLAAKYLGIGYKAQVREGNVVVFGGRDKKEYTLTEEGKAKRAEALRKANATRRAKKEAEAAAKAEAAPTAAEAPTAEAAPETAPEAVNGEAAPETAPEAVNGEAAPETAETAPEATEATPEAAEAPAATGRRRQRSHA